MPKKENLELKAMLQDTACELLGSQGYAATSYQAIADAAGVTRAVVQYYYPRKMDMAIDFLNRLMDACEKVLGIETLPDGSDPRVSLQEAYEIGCLYYGYLFSTKGTRALMFDILKDRELTEELIDLHYVWYRERLDPAILIEAPFMQDQIIAMGGFYELMYQTLKHDRSFDIGRYVVSTTNTIVVPSARLDPESVLAAPSPFDAKRAREIERLLSAN